RGAVRTRAAGARRSAVATAKPPARGRAGARGRFQSQRRTAARLPGGAAFPDPPMIENLADLRRLYKDPTPRALAKQIPALERHSRKFISLSPFCLIATRGVDGL